VITTLKAICSAAVIINRLITIVTGNGFDEHYDRCLLWEFGESIDLTWTWSDLIMERMGFVRRKGTKVTRSSIWTLKYLVLQIMLININKTGIPMIPVSDMTMEVEGTSEVAITVLEDKRQMTGVIGVLSLGQFISPDIIYQISNVRSQSSNSPWLRYYSHWHTLTSWIGAWFAYLGCKQGTLVGNHFWTRWKQMVFNWWLFLLHAPVNCMHLMSLQIRPAQLIQWVV